MKKIELLAPAGDLKRCKTAIRYGADAVYLGGQSFSLRSRASNFTLEDIREACAFAKEYGASIHVTVNIIPHNEDFEGLKEYAVALQEAGVKAVIVASPSIMKVIREAAPQLEIHCSTQMSITNSATASVLSKRCGLDRVVLARECTMDEVREITANSPVDTEAFIHGGMCINYSGRCTLSNRMTLRDANRGGCAQSCRWMYRLFEGDQEISNEDSTYTMGSKDLCSVNQVAELMEIGVASLKIEGRMKTEYYVASIVSAYRHLIDEIMETGGPLSTERMKYHQAEIMKGENREVCDGFYSHIANETSVISHPNSDQDVNHGFLGTVKEVLEDQGELIVETRNPFAIGDRMEVLSPGVENRVFTCESIRTDRNEILEKSRIPMRCVRINAPAGIVVGDILRRA